MRRTLTLGAAIVAFAIAGGCDARSTAGRIDVRETARVAAPAGARVIVRGCRAEDSCRPNYRRDGTWAIRRVSH
jgi:hypothetical protein